MRRWRSGGHGSPDVAEERAVDTNLIVRYVTRDDPVQERQARALFLAYRIFVPTTVLLETEWVLRVAYRYPRDRIADVIMMLIENDGVRVEAPDKAKRALAAFRDGLDLADALHLTACADVETFVTFDKPLVTRAPRAFATPRVIAP